MIGFLVSSTSRENDNGNKKPSIEETHFFFDEEKDEMDSNYHVLQREDSDVTRIPCHITIKADASSADETDSTAAETAQSISFGYYHDNGVIDLEHTLAEYEGLQYLEEFRFRLNDDKLFQVQEEKEYDDLYHDDDDDGSSIHLNPDEMEDFEKFVEENDRGAADYGCLNLLALDLEDDDEECIGEDDIRLIRFDDEESLHQTPSEPAGLKFASREYRRTEVRDPGKIEEASRYANIELVHLEGGQVEDVLVPEKFSISSKSNWSLGNLSDLEEDYKGQENEATNLEPVGIKLASGEECAEVRGYSKDGPTTICQEAEPLELVHLEKYPPRRSQLVSDTEEEVVEEVEATEDVEEVDARGVDDDEDIIDDELQVLPTEDIQVFHDEYGEEDELSHEDGRF